MFKYFICVLCLGLSASACSSHLAVLQKDKYDTSIAIDEMRMELSDVKHTLSNTQVEMQILEEKVRTQDQSLQKSKNQTSSIATSSDQKLILIEKKLAQLEKIQDKLTADLKQLSAHANQTTQSLTQYQVRIKELETELTAQTKMIEELSELKGTLKTITQAIKGSHSSSNVYKVKAGDSLEKIARSNRTSVEALKKMNNLTSTKIVIGQEIKIPHGES